MMTIVEKCQYRPTKFMPAGVVKALHAFRELRRRNHGTCSQQVGLDV